MDADKRFLTKNELSSLVAKRIGKKKSDVDFIVNTIINTIIDGCVKTGGCEIRGFGKFIVVKRKGWTAYNFKTKEPVQIEPFKKVKFIPAKTWDILNSDDL